MRLYEYQEIFSTSFYRILNFNINFRWIGGCGGYDNPEKILEKENGEPKNFFCRVMKMNMFFSYENV